MSNFEDYDLRMSGRTRGRSTGSTNRSNNGQTRSRAGYESNNNRVSYDLSLDDIDMYEYGSESYEGQPRRSASQSASRSASRSRSAAPHSASAPGVRRGSSSKHKSSKSGSSRRPSSSSRKPSGRKGGKKNKRKKARTAIIVVEIVIILVLLLVFFLWNKVDKINSGMKYEAETNDLDEETVELLSNYTTIALFGVDNRSSGNTDSGNSDTIMIAAINNDTKEVKLVSVQRDTYLKVTSDKYRKCNYAYNAGGAESACNMLNENLDISIDAYVAVDFYALATIVDDLGGLELEITSKMINTDNPKTNQNALAGYIAEVENVLDYYPNEEDGFKMSDCYFDSPGTYTLNGAQVVGYCRNRYAVNNDYERAENQRLVVKLIIEKAKKADIATLNKITDDVFPSISTSLSSTQIISMASSVADYSIVDSTGFPFDLTTGTYGSKGSLVVPCTLTTNVTKLHEYLYNQTDYDTTDAVDAISDKIQNDTGTSEGSATVNQESD